MNQIAKEIASYLGSAEMSDSEFLEHYGMPRRSGRYPWGSGEDPYQHGRDFLSRVEELKKQGWQETTENIKKEFGMNTKQYRMEKSICKDQRRMYKVDTAKALKLDGLNNSEIARKMGVNESVVRSWFNEESDNKMRKCKETAEFLKQRLDELPEGKKMIDVGVNAERELNISRERLDTALYMLEKEGYPVHGGGVPQVTNKNQQTVIKALCAKGTPHSAIFNYENVQPLTEYISRDSGITFEKKFTYPSSMDSKRMMVRYDEDGGTLKDGIVELRRGVKDLSLGESRYAQVRILVDDTHYIKGMAVYSDDMPDGVDIIFNTNKSKDRYPNKLDVLKEIKKDPDNPFGSAIKDADQGGQYWYDSKTGERVSSSHPNAKLGLINKRSDEGDWSEWADTLPSQFLAKQSKQMAKKQLDLAKADKEAEFDEIMSLTNPTIKKHYLEKFASECDSAAVNLKAAALPGQKYHVIIPINTLKDTEVYAPQYKDGTKLALIRYPHGGIFEIPILTVNNKNGDAKNIIGPSSTDAVGINKKIADMLSGADFDGDTVMCIPTHDKQGKVKITNKKDGLEGLKGFDNKALYQYTHAVENPDGTMTYYRGTKKFHVMKATDNEMGKISNLITDMTLAGATEDELARAVRHSMVVIDAEKHKLDYQQSYKDNNIAALKATYQRKVDPDTGEVKIGGASTIISRAKGVKREEKRRGEPKKNIKGKEWYDPTRPEGALIYTKAKDEDLYYANQKYNKKTGVVTSVTADGKTFTYNMYNKDDVAKYEPVLKKDSKTGKAYYTSRDGSIRYQTIARTFDSTQMAETDDAMTLVSKARHPMELLYADYANSMKAMANRARVEVVNTGNLEYSKTANKIYKNEVSSLEVKLNDALKNSPRERYAGRLAASEVKRKTAENPDMKPSEIKKISQRSLAKAREEVGSVSRRARSINITDKEWEAIQAGAISENQLKKILNNSDPAVLREKAMPKDRKTLSTAQINRMKRLADSNFTLNQIAEKMNIPASTVSKYLKGEK